MSSNDNPQFVFIDRHRNARINGTVLPMSHCVREMMGLYAFFSKKPCFKGLYLSGYEMAHTCPDQFVLGEWNFHFNREINHILYEMKYGMGQLEGLPAGKPIDYNFFNWTFYSDAPSYRGGRIQEKLNPVEKPNSVVVCFSGGKDSVATALKCREMGYDVHLYHVHGINHSYPDEVNAAKEIASYLDMPLYVENVTLGGKSSWKENPVKNQLIATMALDYANENGFGQRIAIGDFKNDHRERAIYGVNWTDTIEMWIAYTDYIKCSYPDFELIMPFDNYFQTMDAVAQDMNLLKMVQGCIAPMRYRDYWHNKNLDKFGEEVILPHRCGSCWKCCREYAHLADTGILPMNEKFYKKCMRVLKKKEKEI